MFSVKSIQDYFGEKIWLADIQTLNARRAFFIKMMRFLYVSHQEISRGNLMLRATNLVYTTLLSLVPLLAVSFSVLKSFGVHNQLEPFLEGFFSSLGSEGNDVVRIILDFVNNMKVGVLGAMGILLLIYTVISLIQKIEEAFNDIWRVRKTRTFVHRFSMYMSVILVGPVLVFSALALTASLMSTSVVKELIAIQPFGMFFYLAGKMIPYIFICLAFTLLYILIPNTKVAFKSALVGGITAGVTWQTAEWLFTSFVVSTSKYPAIYAGFAVLIFFMIWLYISWIIILLGSKIAFYHQYPQIISIRKDVFMISSRLQEQLALVIMYLIGEHFCLNKQPWTLRSLVNRLGLPVETTQDMLMLLEKKGLIIESGEEPPAYLPSRDTETITIQEILNTVRCSEEAVCDIYAHAMSIPRVDTILKKVDAQIASGLSNQTLKGLIINEERSPNTEHSTKLNSEQGYNR
jgi:membrane protein